MFKLFKPSSNHKPENALGEMERLLSAGVAVLDKPAPDPVKVNTDQVTEEPPAPVIELEWKRKPARKVKTTVVPCIVIDKDDHWHHGALVDLKGVDASAYTWGYYGSSYPVLIEQEDGTLEPFNLPDTAGESSNRLYKGANPDGFKATFKHRGSLLTKIQVGLMIALVFGLFFIMIVLIGW